jgi:hypothetical protein
MHAAAAYKKWLASEKSEEGAMGMEEVFNA